MHLTSRNNVALGLKDCTQCRYSEQPGTVATRIDCSGCNGTGNGPRGGKGGCRTCRGTGADYDHVNRSVCPACDGKYSDAEYETRTDAIPNEIFAQLEWKVYRHNRKASFNESNLGLNCLWSSIDYGKAITQTDAEVLAAAKSREGRVQAVKVMRLNAESEARWREFKAAYDIEMRQWLAGQQSLRKLGSLWDTVEHSLIYELADHIGIFVNRDGYSVRAVFDSVDAVETVIASELV